jgi:hypothetical protein
MTTTDDGNTPEQPGQEPYFVNESDEVTGIGFHIEGAAYEKP